MTVMLPCQRLGGCSRLDGSVVGVGVLNHPRAVGMGVFVTSQEVMSLPYFFGSLGELPQLSFPSAAQKIRDGRGDSFSRPAEHCWLRRRRPSDFTHLHMHFLSPRNPTSDLGTLAFFPLHGASAFLPQGLCTFSPTVWKAAFLRSYHSWLFPDHSVLTVQVLPPERICL